MYALLTADQLSGQISVDALSTADQLRGQMSMDQLSGRISAGAQESVSQRRLPKRARWWRFDEPRQHACMSTCHPHEYMSTLKGCKCGGGIEAADVQARCIQASLKG
eukprot:352534-Chlamydomonas_euryale.AAC.3